MDNLSRFEQGLRIGQEYFCDKNEWDVNYKTVYKEFPLGAWWTSTRRSIAIGSFEDTQINQLKDSKIEFDIVPLEYEQWFDMVKRWIDDNKAYPNEHCMVEEYCIGKWYKRNKRVFDGYLERGYVLDTLNPHKSSLEQGQANTTTDIRWELQYEKFSNIWRAIKDNEFYSETSHTSSIYRWGRAQIEAGELEEWKRNKLNLICMEWDLDKYDMIFSPWSLKFNAFKKMYMADERELSENYRLCDMQKFAWAKEAFVSGPEKWKRDLFHSIGINSLQELRMATERAEKCIKDVIFYKKTQELNQNRLNGDEEGILSIRVTGRKIDYVKSDVVNAFHECDYYEVRIQLSSLFNNDEFKEYVHKNRKRFIECGKRAVTETRKSKGEYPYEITLKVDKMVYGLTSHIVSIMFSIGLS